MGSRIFILLPFYTQQITQQTPHFLKENPHIITKRISVLEKVILRLFRLTRFIKGFDAVNRNIAIARNLRFLPQDRWYSQIQVTVLIIFISYKIDKLNISTCISINYKGLY